MAPKKPAPKAKSKAAAKPAAKPAPKAVAKPAAKAPAKKVAVKAAAKPAPKATVKAAAKPASQGAAPVKLHAVPSSNRANPPAPKWLDEALAYAQQNPAVSLVSIIAVAIGLLLILS